MSATLVLHWPLDRVTGQEVIDSSPARLNGSVTGTLPSSYDERFGTCLQFDPGKVTLPGGPRTQLTAYTIEAWVRPLDLAGIPAGDTGSVILGKESDNLRLSLRHDGSVVHTCTLAGGTVVHVATGPGKVADGAWAHLALTNDGTRARVYLDGVLAAEQALTTARAADSAGLSVVGKAAVAHVRVYDGELSAAEIAQDMNADQAALGAFVRTHPLAFQLIGADEQPVLYIDDSSTGQPMTLRITNTSRTEVTLAPNPSAYYFRLRFRPGTLTSVAAGTPGWGLTTDTDHTTAALVATAGQPIGPGKTLDLALTLKADGTGGGRGTRVELDYAGITYTGQTQELTGTRLQYLDIVNHRGRTDVPLDVVFVGGDRVLSDGVTQSALTLHITNVSRAAALPLTSGSTEFVISFQAQLANETRPSALIASTSAAAATLTAPTGWTPTKEDLGQRLQWTLRPQADVALAAGTSIEVKLDGLIGLASLGHAPIIVEHRNIPGYQDGFVSVPVEKTPLLYTGAKTRIGGAAFGDGLLTVTDTDHQLQLTGTLSDTAASRVFLELRQPAVSASSAEVATGILFNQPFKYWHRLEASAAGLTVRTGDITKNDLSDFGAATVSASSLNIDKNRGSHPGGALVMGHYGELVLDYTSATSSTSDTSSIQATGELHLNPRGGHRVKVGFPGISEPGLTVYGAEQHLTLEGSDTGSADSRVFLELHQKTGKEIKTNIRFAQDEVYWSRIEAGTAGFAFRDGDMNSTNLVDTHAATVHANALTIGSVTIGQNELEILKKLAAGTLNVDIFNTDQGEYLYAADYAPFDDDRRRVFTWRRKTWVSQGRWQMRDPG
jgi:hypothetical protein